MSRQSTTRVALLLIALTALTGCHPTQPFYFHEDGDLSHYLDTVQEIEYPDVETTPLPDASESQAPLTVTNSEFKEIWDLALEECVTIALQNSKTIRNLGGVTPFGFADALVGRTAGASTVYDPAIMESGQNGVEFALAAFDAQLQIIGASPGGGQGAIYNRVDRTVNSGIPAFPTINDQDQGGLRTQLVKPTATGAVFTFLNQTQYDRANNGFTGIRAVPSDWSTQFETRVDYPLLRNRGTLINRIPIVLARINTDIALSTFEASVRNLALDIENTYWDLHRAYRDLETAKTGRDSALVTWKKVSVELQFGTSTVQAEAQAREQYFNFRARVEQSLQLLYETETRLRWLMGLAATDGRLIRPIDEPTMARVDFDWPAIRTEALVRGPELRGKKWLIKQRELELIRAKNQLLPQLDVGAFYRWFGRGDDLIDADNNGITFPGEGSTAFEELTRGNYQEAGFFLQFQMPVGFRRELAGVRNAQLNLAREKDQLKDMELNATHLLSTAIRNLDGNFVQAQTHFNRWSASEKEVDSVNELYKGGKTTVDLVLEAQRRRANAQAAYYQTLVEYNKAIAEVHFRKGSLLEYNNICLAEGPWPHKAYWDALGHARERDASYYLDYGWTRPSVVSRGPVPQQMGSPAEVMPTPAETVPTPAETVPTPAETVPTPEPTPADSPDAETSPDDLPRPDPAPTAERPSVPMLNAPVIRTAAAQSTGKLPDNPLRSKSFQWGSLGMDAKTGGASKTVSPVRPATFVDSVTD